MGVSVEFNSRALDRRLADIQNAGRPDGRAMVKIRGDIYRIVVDDNRDKLLSRHVDRYGKPLAPLAASTLKSKKRGRGGPLVPHGAASRFITNFQPLWEMDQGFSVLTLRYVGITGKDGRSFAQFHLDGTRFMPRRDVGGITPAGWAKIEARHAQLPAEILRSGGGR